MTKRLFIFLILTLILLTSCQSRYSAVDSSLEDMGGVYSVNEDDIDFGMEVAGKLSESKTPISSIGIEEILKADGPEKIYSNKLLRWGISRRENNQTPAADPGAPELLSRNGGAYIGDVSQKTIYLTFDEGYENGYTPLILDTLRDAGVKAVFFITGPYLKGHQDLVMRMVEEGHEVGNHTIHHPSLPELEDSRLEEEILGLDRAFYEKFNRHMRFLRPPKGEYSERTLALTNKLGYCNLFWSFAYDDWYRDRIRGTGYARRIVIRNIHNGAVLLLHAVSKDNAEALQSIIQDVKNSGFTIGNPDEILEMVRLKNGQ